MCNILFGKLAEIENKTLKEIQKEFLLFIYIKKIFIYIYFFFVELSYEKIKI